MDNNEQLLEDYNKLKEEFETYQSFAETTIQIMNEKNNVLEKKLDSLTNIVEVSKYINSNLSDNNLMPMINDMIIGILGVTYSSIYLMKDGDSELIIKASNIIETEHNFSTHEYFKELNNGKPFVINSKKKLFTNDSMVNDIHSLIGVPIYLRDRFIGYIIVEHTLFDFFGYEHIKFISAIANQIGIALENNILYNRIRENSIRDPLLGIYNRKYFFEYVEEKAKKKPDKKFVIVMIDIDNFKKFNDSYGHQFGDKVLIEIAAILNRNMKSGDRVARYGGEEIVIYIDKVENYKAVFERIDDIRKKVNENIVELNDTRASVTASFGISYYPENGNNVQKVVSVADIMLYEAKRTGKNKVVSSLL